MTRKLITRKKYLEDALRFRDTDLVKVVTGVRRCGKSTLLELVRRHLEQEGTRSFIVVNLEDMGCGISTSRQPTPWSLRARESGRLVRFWVCAMRTARSW